MKMEKPKLFGVVGHPIQHSLSPLMHSAAFKELGLNYSYSAFDVERTDLKSFLDSCRGGDFLGVNVTIPYKVDVIKYLDVLDGNVKLFDAVNTIKFEDKIMLGYNTDGLGCVRALEEADVTVRGRRVLILGAGGASRAIAFQCALEGAEIAISNRTRDKAIKLAKEIRERLDKRILVVNFSDRSLKDIISTTDILINTTSIGMYPRMRRSPIAADVLSKELTVMDIIYNPVETQLLRNAKRLGCKTVDGVEMFVHQGAESLKIWLDVKPPLDVMRKAVLEKLR
jgi:shikimate dehydrogenase